MRTCGKPKIALGVVGATVASATAGLVFPGIVSAQVLEEVMVTAQRREQSLQDVPIAASVFDTQRLQRQEIEGLKDFVELSPNVGFANLGSPFDSEVTIRGISNLGGVLNVVGFYIDEFNVAPTAENATFDQRLLDVERVEVLRGPQGTLFGRNVTGGAVNITTQKPGDSFDGYVSGSFGRFDTWQTRAMVNVPVSESLSLRLNGFFESGDGFLDNEGPSDATNDYETQGLRAALRFTPTEDFTWDLSVSYLDHEQNFLNSVPTGQLNDSFTAFGLTRFPLEAGFYPENQDTIQTDRPLEIAGDTLTFINRIEKRFDDFSLVSISGYIDHESTVVGEADHTGFDLYSDDRYETLESWSTELRLQSDHDAGWNWMLGAIYAKDENDNLFFRPFQTGWYRIIIGLPGEPGVDFPAAGAIGPINDRLTLKVTTYGAFGELSWTGLDQRLTLSAGLRYAYDEIDESSVRNRFNAFPPFNSVFAAEAGSADFTDILPRLTANYDLTETANVYASIAKGGKPGGFNRGSQDVPGAPRSYDSEELWNYEVGLKGRYFGGRLSANLALFYMEWKDIQVSSFFIDPVTFASTQLTLNGPEATSEGVELDFALAPFEGFRIEGAVGYNDATFEDFPNAIISETGETGDVSGNQLPGSAEWTGNVAAQYDFGVGEGWQAWLRAEWIYRDEIFRDVENRRAAQDFVPDYDYANLRAGLSKGPWRFIGSVENVLDDVYTTGLLGEESFTGVLATVNPRLWRIQATYRFGSR